MRFRVLACDFDGTIASNGVITPEVAAALRRVRESGRRLLLVTGRTRAQLDPLPAGLEPFDLLVLENGALLLDPATGTETLLCPPVSEMLVAALRARGIEPLHVGRALCATHASLLDAVRGVISALPLEVVVSVNRDGLMILPVGVDKASGARVALRSLEESLAACVAVGDAENDVPLVIAAGCGVAVGSPAESLRRVADVVLSRPDGGGLVELADQLVGDDLAALLAGSAAAGETGSRRR